MKCNRLFNVVPWHSSVIIINHYHQDIMAKITLVIGGARSGKSVFAENIAKKFHNIVYIATAEAKDDEMRERVRVHRARRPHDWKTIEAPFQVDRVVADLNGKADIIFIDCITLYVTNMLLYEQITLDSLLQGGEPPQSNVEDTPPSGSSRNANESTDADNEVKQHLLLEHRQSHILTRIEKLCQACRTSSADVILVSNEVGLGIVPDNALTRSFMDVAGLSNQLLADEADEVYFTVAGIAQKIK
ncbi:MAG: bifunctional adenosylcobinamide kinase/adenosylcobinamide-phosphate guanylyltransferase [Planctomycetota bacterium]